jgi:hypothetical protein
MSLSAYFHYRGADLTESINTRFKGLIEKGVFDYPDSLIIPDGINLAVQIAAFAAVNHQGMVVRSSAIETRAVVDGVINWVVLRAYHDSTIPTGAVLSLETLINVDYLADPQKANLIVLGTVDLSGGGAPPVPAASIEYELGDFIDPVSRLSWRDPIDTFANLPTMHNRDGDLRQTLDSRTLYVWDDVTSLWQMFGTGSLYASVDGHHLEPEAERLRALEGSGLMGSTIGPSSSYGARPELNLHEHATQPYYLGVGPLRAMVNGHFVDTHHEDLDLGVSAGLNTYDVVFLEVWREVIASPVAPPFAYETVGGAPPAPPSSIIAATLRNNLETLAELNNEVIDTNYNVNDFQTIDDNTIVVTKWQFRSFLNVPQTMIANPYDAPTIGTILTRDGINFFSWAGSQSDNRVWIGQDSNASNYDGYTWALPLAIVRRGDITIENAINGYIRLIRNVSQGGDYDDQRWVFPVAPLTDTSALNKQLIDGVNEFVTNRLSSFRPSGVSWNIEGSYFKGSGASTLGQENSFNVKFLGYELTIPKTNVTTLPNPPAVGHDRNFVYLELALVLYPDSYANLDMGFLVNGITGANTKQKVYLQYKTVAVSAGSSLTCFDYLDSNGWNLNSKDPGIWSKSSTDDRVVVGGIYAMPMAMVHRRNTGLWDLSINENGSGALQPQGWSDPTIIQDDEIIDCRHKICDSELELQELLKASYYKLLQGHLYTHMAQHPLKTDVAGKRLLHSDGIVHGGPAIPGSWNVPRDADGVSTIWSEGKEYWVVGSWFDMTGNHNDDLIDYQVATNNLTIYAPAGAYLHTHDEFGVTPIPTFTTEDAPAQPYTRPLYVPTASLPGSAVPPAGVTIPPVNWSVIVTDTLGEPTTMDAIITNPLLGTNNRVFVSFWVVYDRQDPAVAPEYANNTGLYATPDEIVSIQDVLTGDIYAHDELVVPVSTTVTAGLQAIITAADVDTALGGTGAYGVITIHDAFVVKCIGKDFLSTAADITSIEIDNATGDLTVNFGGATVLAGDTVMADIVFSGTLIWRWFQFYRPQRGLTGPWYNYEVTLSGDGASTNFIVTLPPYSTIKTNTTVSVYIRDTTVPGNPWIKDSTWTNTVNNTFASFFSVDIPIAPLVTDDIKICIQSTFPLNNISDEVLFQYVSSPYQGIASSVSDAQDWLSASSSVLTSGEAIVSSAGTNLTVFGEVNVTNSSLAGEPVPWLAIVGGLDRGDLNWLLYKVTPRNYEFYQVLGAITERLPFPMKTAVPDALDAWQLGYDSIDLSSSLSTSGTTRHTIMQPWRPTDSLRNGYIPTGGRPPIPGQSIFLPSGWTLTEETAATAESLVTGLRGYTVTNGTTIAANQSPGVAFLPFGNPGIFSAADSIGLTIFGDLDNVELPGYMSMAALDNTMSLSIPHVTVLPLLLRPEEGKFSNILVMQICAFYDDSSECAWGGTFDAFMPLYRPLVGVK